jgi:sialic acid synthase
MRELVIDGRRIADDSPCYVIAEIGNNHGGSLHTAKQMIHSAAKCGVAAVKFQARTNQTLYSQALLNQPYDHEHSYGKTYGEHREALEFGEHALALCQYSAGAAGVTCFATAFDEASADRLARLQMPAIKIHSGGLTDHALLRHVASLRIPIVLSTGGGTESDIDKAVQTITASHQKLAVLHCTAAYPVLDFKELNLRCILTLRSRYPELVIGWSGHDSGIAMALVAYAFGARIVEKHFTLNRASKGTDHGFSLEPSGMRKLCRDLARAKESLGDGVKAIYQTEFGPISKMRRSYVNGVWQIVSQKELVNEQQTIN